jgi:S1-C subfamily serine protease
VLVRGVPSGSLAENAGVRAGDVITEVNHKAVADAAQMQQALDRHPKGAPVVVMITAMAQTSTWPWRRSWPRAGSVPGRFHARAALR